MRWIESSLVALLVLPALPSRAHFRLLSPDSSREQDSNGSPQKLGPCGDEAAAQKATGKLTTFRAGDTVRIEIAETIYHPGHYRVAIAQDRSALPAEPPVTAGATPCGSVPIDNNPSLPVLADGLLAHTKPFSGDQSMSVVLPSDLSCEHCTLQLIEFMSDHGLNNPGGCFYHHCADLRVELAPPDASAAVDASTSSTDSGVVPVPPPQTGSTMRDASSSSATRDASSSTQADAAPSTQAKRDDGCALASGATPVPLLGLLLLLGRRRRRTA